MEGPDQSGPNPREIIMMNLSVAEMFVNRLSVPLGDLLAAQPTDFVKQPARVSLFWWGLSGAAIRVIAALLGQRPGVPVLAAPVAQA